MEKGPAAAVSPVCLHTGDGGGVHDTVRGGGSINGIQDGGDATLSDTSSA